ncbi:hypothetical protein JCM24511_04561 [Saitozyma sp. JCM 24511]|nr:hypothetical protein JCM24511_04561 [Saitozyma sp. JCM 24511]
MARTDPPAASMHHTYPVPRTTQPPTDAKPKYGRLFFHVAVAGIMARGFLGLNDLAAGKHIEYQYLTIVGLMTSGVVMMLSAINDLLPATTFIRPIKRSLLLFSMPVEIVITSIYWTLVAIKPELMFPPNPDLLDPFREGEPSTASADLLFRIPLWMDFSMHALPAISLLIDFFLFERRYKPPASTRGATLLAVCFGTTYSLWVEYCATINEKFPYPFLNVMDPIQRVVMYSFSTALSLAAFRALNALHA